MFTAAVRRDTLRLVHYWWPLVVGWSVTLVVHRATQRTPDPAGLAFLLAGIGAAYSLDRILDAGPQPPRPWVTRTLTVTAAAFIAAGCLIVRRLPLETAAIVPLLSAVALLYRSLKRVPLAKNLFVPLVWTWATIALPFPDGSWFGWRWIAEPIAGPLFLLLAAGVLLCDLKDEPHDRRDGVSSLAVVVGGRRAAWVGVGLGLAAGLAAYVENRSGLAVSAFSLSLTALWPRLLATDVVGPLVVDVILSMPGFLIAWHLV